MPSLSEKSRKILSTCDPRLQRICEIAIRIIDFSVLEGHRGIEDQERYFSEGKSKLHWPNSGHNTTPSIALDLVPFPINWQDVNRFHLLAGVIFGVAISLNIKIRWGGDFNMNMNSSDEKFKDLPHFELYETAG